MIAPGSILALDVEKPAAGGRMLARHEGQVVLVWGAIPGERVSARVERTGKGVVYADTMEVLTASPDRRTPITDWRCGGNVFAHISYERQVALKGEIIKDAFGRIGRLPLPAAPLVIASPERGYRMRARLHVQGGRVGFYREGTHELCDARSTGQLADATNEWLTAAEARLGGEPGLAVVEIAENAPGDQRGLHLEAHDGVESGRLNRLAEELGGRAQVTDIVRVSDGSPAVELRRDARAFFQGNRYLLEPLVRHVASLVPSGPVVDLYAGVGLFGLALAASGAVPVTMVEGDPISGSDLAHNARPFGDGVHVERRSVELYLAGGAAGPQNRTATAGPQNRTRPTTFVVDPPRTGMSKGALAGVVNARPARIVYVSCDVATLARDARALVDAGYTLTELSGFDLFPNTAHVESVALFEDRPLATSCTRR